MKNNHESIKDDQKSLKSVIKSANSRFIENIEADYSESNKKSSQIALTLAKIYIRGKRVEKNLSRAIEILSDSSLRECKYALLELAVELN